MTLRQSVGDTSVGHICLPTGPIATYNRKDYEGQRNIRDTIAVNSRRAWDQRESPEVHMARCEVRSRRTYQLLRRRQACDNIQQRVSLDNDKPAQGVISTNGVHRSKPAGGDSMKERYNAANSVFYRSIKRISTWRYSRRRVNGARQVPHDV